MDSAGRENEGTISRNDLYSSKLASQNSSAGQHVDSQQQKQQLTEELRDSDWEQLEEKYAKAMEEHGKSEEELQAQVAKLLEVFVAWSQTTVLRDEDRALKRLISTRCLFKTQMQHVQNSEERLENKRKHYTDVVKAFESALALLNGRARP
ncbi:uncharacterized protein ASPGLDRAFT_116755 [Aspergillus glaucus CBS 516.65]|uniref:Uncharacterized protein n=1 Tax=Aspergillus glaucus CBS 516.65 TaxID=1160497 RepID=A0A1L9VYE8_ASPGL|nr:hypothetical protein ASPGLDRAFT_116755 [Aspergillus glaucus CBS 516.65]OJJ88909.1 hypothetical protein ASPGLDRAFT_116755 [Aspergillus glaucus CBS 516.65]